MYPILKNAGGGGVSSKIQIFVTTVQTFVFKLASHVLSFIEIWMKLTFHKRVEVAVVDKK